MRRSLLILLALCGAVLSAPASASAAKVMSWNVKTPATEGEIEAVADRIARHRPGVVGLQEVCNQQRLAIVASLGRRGLRYYSRPGTVLDADQTCGPYGSAYGQAILSRNRIRRSNNIIWKIRGDDTFDGDERRGYMWVDTRLAGRSVRVYDTHLGNRWSACNRHIIVTRLARRAARQRRSIVVGDLNAKPGDRVPETCSRSRPRVLGPLYRRSNEIDPRNRSTFDGIGKLDYIFLRGFGRVGASILGAAPSDHHALLGRVR